MDVEMENKILKAESANKFDHDGVQEYGNSIRRHFLNDIVIAYERYSTLMYASYKNKEIRTDPSIIDDRLVRAEKFEELDNIYLENEKKFFNQLRRLRNSIIHFNGVYCKTNELDYTFKNQKYFSKGYEGQNITIEFDTILWIYNKIIEIVEKGNKNYFSYYYKDNH